MHTAPMHCAFKTCSWNIFDMLLPYCTFNYAPGDYTPGACAPGTIGPGTYAPETTDPRVVVGNLYTTAERKRVMIFVASRMTTQAKVHIIIIHINFFPFGAWWAA